MSFATQKPTHCISPDDVKVLKEALEYHAEESRYLNACLDGIHSDLKESTEKAKAYHARIAEALRRVVG